MFSSSWIRLLARDRDRRAASVFLARRASTFALVCFTTRGMLVCRGGVTCTTGFIGVPGEHQAGCGGVYLGNGGASILL